MIAKPISKKSKNTFKNSMRKKFLGTMRLLIWNIKKLVSPRICFKTLRIIRGTISLILTLKEKNIQILRKKKRRNKINNRAILYLKTITNSNR